MPENDYSNAGRMIGNDTARTILSGDKSIGLHLRALAGLVADRVGARDAIAQLPDLEAVRLLQQREGYTPCYGREEALRPGPDGVCQVSECLWRNFCSAYRSPAIPLDGVLNPLPEPGDLTGFTNFLLSRNPLRPELSVPGLGVTVRAQAQLESLSRKLAIGSPHSTICESSESDNALRPVRLTFTSHEDGSGHYMRYYRLERTILWTANPARLYNWYASARSLIGAATLDYLPHLSVESERIGVWKTNQPEFTQLATPAFQSLATPHVAAQDGEILVSDPNFVPLLNLEIPFLESATLDDIYRVMQDYPDELGALRSFLFRNIDRIKDKRLGSETFGADLEAIRREIDDQIRKLRSDLKRGQVKHYVEIAGGVAAAFALIVFCIVQNESHTLSVVGPGGVLYALSTKAVDYLVSKLALRDNPAYFLWMIGPSKSL